MTPAQGCLPSLFSALRCEESAVSFIFLVSLACFSMVLIGLSEFVFEGGLCASLFATSQANDCHAAPALHTQQRHRPAQETQRLSAFPVWTWIQEGHQQPGQQEVKANISNIRFSVPEVMNSRSCNIVSVQPFLLLSMFALLPLASRRLGN